MTRYINGTGGSYLNPNMQYFGLQNPYFNPNYQAFGPSPLLATTGNLPAENLGPDRSAAIPGEGPSGNKVGSDADPRTPGRQGSAAARPEVDADPFDEKDEDKEDGIPEVTAEADKTKAETNSILDQSRADTMRILEMSMDPERYRQMLEAGEPYYTRIAQRKQKMGLENIEAAGKAAFNYKYGPQMMMTAAASRAAYYPELVRAASDSYTGLNLANAMKPRMSGYYRGLL